MSTDIAVGPNSSHQQADPRLSLDHAEVAEICALLERAAALLTHHDPDNPGTGDGPDHGRDHVGDQGCCHQVFGTQHWRDSVLVAGWLTDLATDLNKRCNTALDVITADTTAADTTGGRF